MKVVVALLGLWLLPQVTFAAESPSPRSNVDVAIDRGLAFLKRDALAWKAKYKCASCHHASLVIWSMQEAKRRGRPVDELFLAELTQWVAGAGDGKTGVPRPPGKPKALNTKAVQFALGLGANSAPDTVSRAGLKLLTRTVQGDQVENGSWIAWPDTRPPFFGSSYETMTALATLALLPEAASGDESARIARDRGIQWLAKTKSDDDPQSVAIRLVIWRQIGRPADECERLARRIKERQEPDGGWNQAKGMPSDAWATGQALYALAIAGIKPREPAIARAQSFLVRSQRDDGSWPMTSRPIKPGGAGSKSLVPITGAGTAWAVIGLSRSH